VVIVATGDGRNVWTPHWAFCGGSARPAGDPVTTEVPSEEWLDGEVQPGSRVRVRDADGEDEYTLVRSGKGRPREVRISTVHGVPGPTQVAQGRRRSD
jgi:hypothetical protein